MFSFLAMTLLVSLPAKAETVAYDRKLSEQLVDFFEAGNCTEILKLSKEKPKASFEPLALALVANCISNSELAKKLFLEAEALKPNSQVILILFAKKMNVPNPDYAKEVWRKVKLFARDDSVRRMAEDNLNGVIDVDSEDVFQISKKKESTLFSKLEANYSSNPAQASMSTMDDKSSSLGTLLSLTNKYHSQKSWGEMGINFGLNGQNYYSHHESDDYLMKLEWENSVNMGDSGIVAFNPYISHEMQGGSNFQSNYGLAVKGTYFGDNYRQSVNAIFYQNKYYDATLSSQQGSHYRFEFDWLFYPDWYEVNFGAFIEHVHANKDQDDANSASIYYTHNDVGLYASVLGHFRKVEVSLTLSGSTRQDTIDSIFQENNLQVSRRRVDNSFSFVPQVTIPLEKNLKLNGYFNYSRTFSNMGSASYTDYNVLSRIYGINLDYQLEWL